MSDFTYEREENNNPLETYEWDNVWWEHATTKGVPRALYIGDSISCATRRVATEEAAEKIFFDGFGTSKALDNPYFTESLHTFAAQQGERAVVLFNNGLHGWHLADESEYAAAYEKMLSFLLDEFKGTPLVLLFTTHVKDAERDARVCERNRVVRALAEKYNLPTVDLYSLTKANSEKLSADGVHLTDEGYKLLAREIVKNVKDII